MTVRNLDAIFNPKSIAVIGASLRAGSIGEMVWSRLGAASFAGPAWAVNPKHAQLNGQQAYADIDDLPAAPTVAVLCTPPSTWPDIVRRLGARGTRAVVIVGKSQQGTDDAGDWTARTLAAARPFLLRVAGPSSVGILTPSLGAVLGAPSCAVRAGGVAWVSGSNALTNGVLGWANARSLGFSRVIALGDEADIDAGDILDFLASDIHTRAVLLAIESVKLARKFMSAARAAARNKPVLILRTGRSDSFDALYSAAFRRAGMVRVDALDDLLDEIETLGVGRIAASDRATVITSDRGVAALAEDAFLAAGDALASWPDGARESVLRVLPEVQPDNPLQLGDNATAADFGAVLEALAPHRETGTAFVVHAPTHTAPVAEVARVLIEQQRHAYRGLLACFFGCVDAATRDALHARGIAVHTTPQRLARGFARLVDYRRGQVLLMQTPDGPRMQSTSSLDTVRVEIKAMVTAGVAEMEGERAARVLAQFGLLAGPGQAPLRTPETLQIDVRLLTHSVFGPVFEFTAPAAPGLPDGLHEFALPPLNSVLARDLVMRSPRARELPAEQLLDALTALSELVCDVEEVVALQLRIHVSAATVTIHEPVLSLAAHREPLAVQPYPRRLEQTFDWKGIAITVRPIRPDDEAAHSAFVSAMTPEDLRLRFFSSVRSFDHSQLARMTQIDYDREMAFIAMADENGSMTTLGVARAIADPDNESAEFAVAVRSDQKGKRLGMLLMTQIIAYCKTRGTRWMIGEALRENTAMIQLARKCGFQVSATEDPGVVGFRLRLANLPDETRS